MGNTFCGPCEPWSVAEGFTRAARTGERYNAAVTRLRSILLNVLTAGCVLGAVGLALLWVRSIHCGDVLTYLPADDDGYTLRSVPGGIEFGCTEHLRDAVSFYHPLPAGWSLRHEFWDADEAFRPRVANVH